MGRLDDEKQVYTVELTGLTRSTDYYYRVVAINSIGNTSSEELMFRTFYFRKFACACMVAANKEATRTHVCVCTCVHPVRTHSLHVLDILVHTYIIIRNMVIITANKINEQTKHLLK